MEMPMISLRPLPLLAALFVLAAPAGAQGKTAKKAPSPARDSVKALDREIRQDKAKRKRAQAAGDTAAAKAAAKQVQEEKAKRKAIKDAAKGGSKKP
jgi:hypothetical protein